MPLLPRVLRRPRLLTLIDRALASHVAWVMGPPGSGKTTLVASYVQARRRPTVWVRLDEGDADLSSFVHYVTLALEGSSGRRRPPLPALTPEVGPGASVFLRRFFERVSDRLPPGSVIVLDNYHDVPESASLHAWLPGALSHVTRHVAVVIVSRLPPPAAWMPLELRGDLGIVPPQALDLTAAESEALVALHHRAASPAARRAYRRHLRLAGGWVAGATLLLKRAPGALDVDARRLTGALGDVFVYLANETLDRAPVARRRFLLETSLLPEFTGEIARSVTGAAFAAPYLAELHRARFFTEQTQGDVGWYRYHPLFRGALTAAAEQELSADRIGEVRRAGGEALVRAGLVDAGITLLMAGGDWPAAGTALLQAAPTLVAHGRLETLAAWLEVIPPGVADTQPWLHYWRALCHVLTGSPEAERASQGTIAAFDARGDQLGALAARSLIVMAQFVTGGALQPLDSVLDGLPAQPLELPKMPSEWELSVVDLFASALVWREPGTPRTEAWVEHALTLRRRHLPPSGQAVPFPSIEQYYVWNGDRPAAEHAFGIYKCYVQAIKSPSSALARGYADAVLLWQAGDAGKCRRVIEDSLAESRREGLPMWEQALSAQAVYNALFSGDLALAGEVVARTRPTMGPRDGLFATHHQFLEAWTLFMQGNVSAAWEIIRPEHHRPEIGAGPFASCLSRQLRSYIKLAQHECEEATALCGEAMTIAESMGSDYMRHGVAFVRSACAFGSGDERQGHAALGTALTMGRRRQMWGCPGWDARAVARLVSKALAADVEPDYARELLRRRWLPRPADAVMPDEWSWAVEIRALGGFEVRTAGMPLAKWRKSPHRLLELLRALIVLGGVDVSVASLCDWFWPDTEGDIARENLDKTLQRLRRLLGHPDVLPVRAGRLSLNPDLVWVDALAFEKLLTRDDPGGKSAALRLYAGPLFGSMPMSAPELAHRKRLEHLHLRAG